MIPLRRGKYNALRITINLSTGVRAIRMSPLRELRSSSRRTLCTVFFPSFPPFASFAPFTVSAAGTFVFWLFPLLLRISAVLFADFFAGLMKKAQSVAVPLRTAAVIKGKMDETVTSRPERGDPRRFIVASRPSFSDIAVGSSSAGTTLRKSTFDTVPKSPDLIANSIAMIYRTAVFNPHKPPHRETAE